ncbi:MAG: ATP-binding cassette domain-containing protein [Planctomycetaceae bacterium]|nr:ATP-binding cassette domain-containing protein [Planctomycetaceae bacterium]
MQISVAYDFRPKTHTTHTAMVRSHFGIDFETGRNVIAENLELPIEPGDLVCFTGSSGAGKSSLLRAVAGQLSNVINIDDLEWRDVPLIDALDCPFDEALHWLSLCGLSEAQLMLRTPAELSEGQRYRFRLALGLSRRPDWLLADEFTATLDRVLARVISCNIRKLGNRENLGFLLATTHEDILDELQPDLHVQCDLAGEITFSRNDRQKKVAACSTNSSSPPDRNATGRTSLGGITAVTTWSSSAS